MSLSNCKKHFKCPQKLDRFHYIYEITLTSTAKPVLSLSHTHTHTHTHISLVHLLIKMIDLVIQVTFQSNREEHEPV